MSREPSRRIIHAQGAASVADGAVAPTVVLYLTTVHDLGAQYVGTVLGGAAGLALLAGPWVGRWIDRLGFARAVHACAALMAVALVGHAFGASPLLLTAAVLALGVGRPAMSAAVQGHLAAVTIADQRVGARGRLHAANNGGFAGGAIVGALVIAVDDVTVFRLLFLGAAGVTVLCALVLSRTATAAGQRLSPPPLAPRPSALRDRTLVAVTALSAALALTMPVLTVILPIWMVTATAAPAWSAAAVFALNATLVLLLQVPWSRRIVRDRHAAISSVVAGFTIATSCVCFATMSATSATAATVTVALGVVLLTLGEVAAGPAAWHLALRDAPDGQHSEYQSVFGMSHTLGRILGPIAALPVVLAWGRVGWLVVGLAILFAGLLMTRLARRAERTRAAGSTSPEGLDRARRGAPSGRRAVSRSTA